VEARDGDQVGQPQRTQLIPIGVGQPSGIAQRERADEARCGAGNLHCNRIAAALAPGQQPVRRLQFTRTARCTHRAVTGNARQHGMTFGVEAARIDPRAWRPQPQRQPPLRPRTDLMTAPTLNAHAGSGPWIAPGDLQALARQCGMPRCIADLQDETGMAARRYRQIDDAPADHGIADRHGRRQLLLQRPLTMQGRPRCAEQQRGNRAAAPRQRPPQAGHGAGQRAAPERWQRGQQHARQGAADERGSADPANGSGQRSIGGHRISLPRAAPALLSGNDPRSGQRRTLPRWKLTRKLAPPPTASPTLTEPP
jgi:hypothetical protein